MNRNAINENEKPGVSKPIIQALLPLLLPNRPWKDKMVNMRKEHYGRVGFVIAILNHLALSVLTEYRNDQRSSEL